MSNQQDTTHPVWLQAAGLGAVAGMRTWAAPAMLSMHLHKHEPEESQATFLVRFFSSDFSASALGFVAAGELLGDKLPIAPDRTWLPALIGRACTGAAVGAALFELNGDRALPGALLGGAAAVASAFTTEYLRRTASDLMNPSLVAAAEDVLAAGTAKRLLEGRAVPGISRVYRFVKGFSRATESAAER
jgi:uncharacterized membrane protein